MGRKFLWALALFVAVLAIGFALLYTPDTDRAAMQAKYGGTIAQYAETLNGLTVHYRDQGNAQGPVLILLHGSSASLQTWEPWVDRLGARLRIITLDLPGHGLTGPHPTHDYTAAGMAEAVDAVAAAEGLDRFILGGNSMGGWVAWRYAFANPQKVEALILVDAAGMPVVERASGNIGFKLMSSPVGRALAKVITPRALVATSLRQSVYVEEIVTEEMIDRYWELIRHPGNREATARRGATVHPPFDHEKIREIAVPTLILWGREDSLIPVAAAHEFDKRLPDSTLVILDEVGHIPMEEAPDASAMAVREFISGL